MSWFDTVIALANTPLYSWPAIAVFAALALLLALLLHGIGSRVLRRLTRPHVIGSLLLRHIDRPARAALIALALQLVWGNAPDTLPLIPALRALTLLALVAALTWLASASVRAVRDAIVALHPIEAQDNIGARSIHTQARVLSRCATGLVLVIGVAAMLMTVPNVREIGASLLASAGVAGLVAGIAARPVLANLIAGLQIALSQPVRIEDVVVINGEWGRVEEITGSYVAVRIWDQRQLIVPLQWLIENPFQNWTRNSSQLLGTVFLWVDYRLPLAPVRQAFEQLCEAAPEWDGRVRGLVVTDSNERAMQIRMLVSSVDSSKNWDLRCKVREGMLTFIQQHYPQYLPRVRAELGPTHSATVSATHPAMHSAMHPAGHAPTLSDVAGVS